MRFQATRKQEQEIVDLYTLEFKTLVQISKIYSCERNTVTRIIKNNGIKIRGNNPNNKHLEEIRFDRDYFRVINTEAKAYFLGLIYADGNIYLNRTKISLQERDGEILKAFAKDVKYQGNLYLAPKEKENHQNQLVITVCSNDWISDLCKLGVFPKKSFILKFPTLDQVPNYLIHHFIRGYFDGDGCISFSNPIQEGWSYRGYFSVVGTEDFCNTLNKVFEEKYKVKTSLFSIKNSKMYVVSTGSSSKIFSLYKILYQDAHFYLNRKKDKFEKFLNFNGLLEEVSENSEENS